VSHTTPNIVASHGQQCNKFSTSQSGTNISENYIDLSQNEDAHNKSDTFRSLSTVYAPHNGHEGGSPDTPLTARVLYKHNVQQARISQSLESRPASQNSNVAMLWAAVVPSNDTIHGPNNGRSGCFYSNSLDPFSRTQSLRHSIGSMCSEADYGTYIYQSIGHWQSRPFCQHDVIDLPGSDISDFDPLSWDTDQGQELTAWGNALAGVGEHLVDHNCQEYTNHDELVVD
jgi:hypothetical protein